MIYNSTPLPSSHLYDEEEFPGIKTEFLLIYGCIQLQLEHIVIEKESSHLFIHIRPNYFIYFGLN